MGVNYKAWGGYFKIQETETYEFGIKDMYKNTYISASVFLMSTENEIYYDSINGVNKNFNGKVERKGLNYL